MPSVFNPGDAEQYGFVVDDFHWPRHKGTASFSIEDDPAWPNFLYGLTNDTYDPWDGIGNVSWTPKCDKMLNAGRRDSPLGPVCCRCVDMNVEMPVWVASLCTLWTNLLYSHVQSYRRLRPARGRPGSYHSDGQQERAEDHPARPDRQLYVY